MEPEKCEGWSWKTWADIREFLGTESAGENKEQRLFLPIINLLNDYPNIQDLM